MLFSAKQKKGPGGSVVVVFRISYRARDSTEAHDVLVTRIDVWTRELCRNSNGVQTRSTGHLRFSRKSQIEKERAWCFEEVAVAPVSDQAGLVQRASQSVAGAEVGGSIGRGSRPRPAHAVSNLRVRHSSYVLYGV